MAAGKTRGKSGDDLLFDQISNIRRKEQEQ
jgi:hypothetical protein